MPRPTFMLIPIMCMLQLLSVAQTSPRAIEDYERLINHYRYYKQDSAVWFAARAMDFARRSKDSSGVGMILIEQGLIDDNQGKFEESEVKYRHALELFNKNDYKKGIATANIRLGVVKLRNGNYDKAIGDFLEALKVSEKIGDRSGGMEANYSISWAYLDQQNYNMALSYLQVASAMNDSLHRVKNNLHTVMSLLESQSVFLENDALTAIRDSQRRVFAMSLIHQRLYQSENVTTINMTVYLPELVNYLRDSFNTRQQIRFQLEIDPIELDVSQAVPLGLILNEAITNAIKYAFPGKKEGMITIAMRQRSEDRILLTVTDNGVGLVPGFDSANNNSLGMRLMKGLSEDINGKFTVSSAHGTAISIAFEKTLALQEIKKLTSSKKPVYQS